MKSVGIADLKARLSSHLKRVKAGQEVLITDRGQPIAKLVPLARDVEPGSRRERLAKAGLLILGHGRLRPSLRVPLEGDTSLGEGVLQALLDERRESSR